MLTVFSAVPKPFSEHASFPIQLPASILPVILPRLKRHAPSPILWDLTRKLSKIENEKIMSLHSLESERKELI